jgi:neutral ceramidase
MLQGSSKRINITPPIGLRLSGFQERAHGSVGILNQLFASILVLGDGVNKVAIVTLDLSGVDKALTKVVRETVSQKTDIRYDSVMLCASHTHSGPEAWRTGDMGLVSHPIDSTPDEIAYKHILPGLIANGIIWANSELEPVKFGAKQSELFGLGSNRIDASRYVDNTVTVFRVDRMTGEPLAILTQYACHPTILNFTNFHYSGDYISYYQETVEKAFPGSIAMFVQGCAGDVSTRHNRKGYGQPEARRMGMLLAGEVIKNATLVDTSDDLKLSIVIEPLKLKIRLFESDAECEHRIKAAQDNVDDLKAKNAPENIQRTACVEIEGALRYYDYKKMVNIKKVDVEMQRVSIGDWNIITTPGETFGEIGARIRNLDPHQHIVVTGYTNGSVGYIPTRATYRNPVGYEVGVALVDETSEDRLVKVAKKLLNK